MIGSPSLISSLGRSRSCTLAAIVAGTAAAFTGHALAGGPATPVISELRTGQPGPDLDEYVEIRGTPGATLNGVWYLVIGDADAARPPAQNGFIEAAINLTGLTIPASGYLVIAESTFSLGVADVIATLPFEDNDNVTHLLVTEFTGGVGTDVDANDDGVLDARLPWTTLLSSVGLVGIIDPRGIAAEFVYSENLVGPDGGAVPQHVFLCQNDDSAYEVAASDPGAGEDTVGAANPTCDFTPPPVQISEIRIDQPSTDNDEFFELSGPPGLVLDGYTYIVIGDGIAALGSGVIEAVVDLTGVAIPADGYLLVTESTFTLFGATPDFVVGANGLNFENDDNVTHLLVKDFTGANGADLDAENDGVIDAAPWTEIVDSVALIVGTPGSGGNELVYSPTIVGPDGDFVPSAVYRCFPTGTWQIGEFPPTPALDTPGTENFGCPSCGGEGSCFAEHASAGCDISDCCELVCAVDPECCMTGWDAVCVANAQELCNAAGSPPVLTINEVRIAQPNADNDEFFEILGAPGTSLDGVAYVVIGDGLDANGVVENVTLLSGTIPGDGFFVVAKSTFTLGNPDLIRDNINFEDGDTVTHLLVWNFNGALGADLDADNNCTLDSTPWEATIDGIVLLGEENCGYAATAVGPDTIFAPAHAFKCTPDNVWTVGLFASTANDTPGFANATCPAADPCGEGAAQDCFTAARTPGCSDADCCNAVCTIDPTCCSAAWDATCVTLANENCLVPADPPAVQLSEIRTDQAGTDLDEYFELIGAPGTSLTGATYIVIGDGPAALGSGVVEMALPLTGFVIPSDGFLLAAKASFTLTGAVPDYVVGDSALIFENGDNVTHMLVWEFEGSVGTDLDTNDDGTLDSPPWTSVIDSVALQGASKTGELVYSTTIVGPNGNFVPSHLKFCPSTTVWTLGTFDPTLSDDSPGAANPDCTYSEVCVGDLDGSGAVNAGDLAILLGAWGPGGGAADLDNDGDVDAGDLAILLGAWGGCP
ncbi:MAG: hypothetical protein SGJ11_05450 [Phycisphaerae bacterium]|nr:hypothetical protein [Phycisphaerae bacterium]